jgi:hypothetical protein
LHRIKVQQPAIRIKINHVVRHVPKIAAATKVAAQMANAIKAKASVISKTVNRKIAIAAVNNAFLH